MSKQPHRFEIRLLSCMLSMLHVLSRFVAHISVFIFFSEQLFTRCHIPQKFFFPVVLAYILYYPCYFSSLSSDWDFIAVYGSILTHWTS